MKNKIYYRKGKMEWLRVTAALSILDTGIGDWKARVGKKEAAKISRTESGIGTKTHKLIEADINNTKIILPKSTPKSAFTAFDAYKRWRQEMNPNILQSEVFVHSDIHGYAGTCDTIGDAIVYDYKTSKVIHPIYWLQLAAYAAAVMEMAAKEGTYRPITKLAVVRLDKESGDYRYVERDFTDDLFHSFLYTLRLWRYFNETEKGELDDDDRTTASIDLEAIGFGISTERSKQQVDRPEDPDDRAREMW
jgi:hypothetical protein